MYIVAHPLANPSYLIFMPDFCYVNHIDLTRACPSVLLKIKLYLGLQYFPHLNVPIFSKKKKRIDQHNLLSETSNAHLVTKTLSSKTICLVTDITFLPFRIDHF